MLVVSDLDVQFIDADEPKRSKKQAAETPVTQISQPVAPSPAPDPSQPSGTNPSELAKKLEGIVYEDFDPLLLKQNEALQQLEFETYDAALDEFYAKVRPAWLGHAAMLICNSVRLSCTLKTVRRWKYKTGAVLRKVTCCNGFLHTVHCTCNQ